MSSFPKLAEIDRVNVILYIGLHNDSFSMEDSTEPLLKEIISRDLSEAVRKAANDCLHN